MKKNTKNKKGQKLNLKWDFFQSSKKPKEKVKKKPKESKVKPPKPPKEPRQITEFEKFYFHRLADRKEYKTRREKFSNEVAPKIIDACGGIKNISKVKAVNYSLEIQFKNLYQVKREELEQLGGLSLKIEDHTITDIFDFTETKKIASLIKKQMKLNKGKFISLDLA